MSLFIFSIVRAIVKYETAKGLVECLLLGLKASEDSQQMNSIISAISSEIAYCKEAGTLF
jgi:hypothetical protein